MGMEPNPYAAPGAVPDRQSDARRKRSLIRSILVVAALAWGVYCFVMFVVAFREMALRDIELDKLRSQPAAKTRAPAMRPSRDPSDRLEGVRVE